MNEEHLLFDHGDDDDNNGGGGKGSGSTGRWTREEHHMFLKGLELHGKGWKKIANLIKTRTVVQIRTHAQKYFLKLQKARQNGSGSVMMDGKSEYRKKRRRLCRKPVALAPPLKPFIINKDNNGNNNGNGPFIEPPNEINMNEDPIAKNIAKYEEAESGIFNFLSAPMEVKHHHNQNNNNNNDNNGSEEITSSSSTNTSSNNSNNSFNNGLLLDKLPSNSNDDMTSFNNSHHNSINNSNNSKGTTSEEITSSSSTNSSSNNSNNSLHMNMNNHHHHHNYHSTDILKVPDWYKQGKGVESLLKDAEGLNWLNDSGGAVPPKAHIVTMPTQSQLQRPVQSSSNSHNMASSFAGQLQTHGMMSSSGSVHLNDIDTDFGMGMAVGAREDGNWLDASIGHPTPGGSNMNSAEKSFATFEDFFGVNLDNSRNYMNSSSSYNNNNKVFG